MVSEDALRQAHVTVQRLSSVSVDADVVVVRPDARRDYGAAEVDGAAYCLSRSDRQRDLHDAGSLQLKRVIDLRRQRGDVARRIPPERLQRRLDCGGINRRQVSLQDDNNVVVRVGINGRHGRLRAVRAGRERRVGQYGVAAETADHIGDLPVTTCDHDGANTRLHCSSPDMGDHGLTVDVLERLARKPGGAET